MAKKNEKVLKGRTISISHKQILAINEGYRIAYRSDSDEIARMAYVFFHRKK